MVANSPQLGFFLSVASRSAREPNRLIVMGPMGGVAVSAGAVILGIGLLGA